MVANIDSINNFNRNNLLESALSDKYDVNQDGIIDDKDFELLQALKSAVQSLNDEEILLVTDDTPEKLEQFNLV